MTYQKLTLIREEVKLRNIDTKMKKIVFSIFYFLISASPALAQVLNIWKGTGSGGVTCNVAGPCTFCDALVVASNIITLLFQIAIPVAVAMIVWGALRLMVAAGSPERVQAGKKIITSAIIGIIIIFAVVVILRTLFHVLTGSPDFPWRNITCAA